MTGARNETKVMKAIARLPLPVIAASSALLSITKNRLSWILKIQLLLLGLLCSFPATRASAQVTCVACPANGTSPGMGIGIFLSTIRTNAANPSGFQYVFSGQVDDAAGACEQIIISTDLGYRALSGTQVGRGYYGGVGNVLAFPGSVTFPGGAAPERTDNVTPASLATTKIGPAGNACADTSDFIMNDDVYTFSAADLAAHAVAFRFDYNGGHMLIGDCSLRVGGFVEAAVRIAPLPTCTVTPATNPVCAGSSASFTATATGAGPFYYSWSGPNEFGSTNAAITITNAQAINSGVYTVLVADQFGCLTTSLGTLTLIPRFKAVRIAGSDLILSGSGGTPNDAYTVLTTTNVGTPPPLWVPIFTNNFDLDGQFTFTNHIDLNESKRYFRLRSP